MGLGGFFNFGGKGRVSDDAEKVVEITQKGKSALKEGNVSGLEAEILDMMKSGAPFTVENLSERLNQKYSWIKTNCKSLVRKRFIEVTSD
jgi:DNA-binding MarR family transcriptional regulator